jgi:hypothetical protein
MGIDQTTPPLVSTPQQRPLAPVERIEMIAETIQCLADCGATSSSSFAGGIPYDDIPIYPLFNWNNWHRKQVPKWKWTKLEPALILASDSSRTRRLSFITLFDLLMGPWFPYQVMTARIIPKTWL